MENYFTEEELADLPDRYYFQREEQQIVLPNPVRPGYHFKNWRNNGGDTIIGSGETKTVKDGKTIITFDYENGLKRGAGGQKLGANLYKRLYGYFQSQRRSIEGRGKSYP